MTQNNDDNAREQRCTPFSKSSVAIFVAAIVLACVLFGLWGLSASCDSTKTALCEGRLFNSGELFAIEAAFADAKLENYEIREGQIFVPASSRGAYILALRKTPCFLTPTETEAPPFWESDKQRRESARREKQTQLARQIQSFHGIESATVLIDIAELKCGFRREITASASVTIRTRASYTCTGSDYAAICDLVAKSIIGLKRENIAIVDTRTNYAWRAPSVAAPGATPSVLQNGENHDVHKIEVMPQDGSALQTFLPAPVLEETSLHETASVEYPDQNPYENPYDSAALEILSAPRVEGAAPQNPASDTVSNFVSTSIAVSRDLHEAPLPPPEETSGREATGRYTLTKETSEKKGLALGVLFQVLLSIAGVAAVVIIARLARSKRDDKREVVRDGVRD
ncbi:MAG: hypothetical protein Q4D38_13135, partial [Planctomycetia bacterium]|nr:hypothetical protein [Planctomycetia bacterium]